MTRWLCAPKERQHAFVGDNNFSLCQMSALGPQHAHRPEVPWCFWCKRRLEYLAKKRRV